MPLFSTVEVCEARAVVRLPVKTKPAVTVNVVEPLIAPDVASIVVVPKPANVANPCEPDALLIVATLGPDELHAAVLVRVCVLASLYVPVAVNGCVVPTAIEAFPGVTAIDTSTAAVTVSVVEPVMLPSVALMLEAPFATLVASPAALIVATLGPDELHAAVLVRVCVLPSLYVPVAVNGCVVPAAIEAFPGVTAIDTSTAAVTVSVVEPVMLPSVALMLEAPFATLVASPAALIVATLGPDELHAAVLVRVCVLPSLYVRVAVNGCVVPAPIEAFPGVTAIDTSTAAVTVSVVEPVMLPSVALMLEVPAVTPVDRPPAV